MVFTYKYIRIYIYFPKVKNTCIKIGNELFVMYKSDYFLGYIVFETKSTLKSLQFAKSDELKPVFKLS